MTFRNLLIVCILLYLNPPIHAQNNAWVQKIDGHVDYLNMAVSPTGTEYMAIQFRDSISYSPNPDSTYTYPALDSFTVCLLKLDAEQKPLASYRYSMTFYIPRNMISQLEFDDNGHLYVSGKHSEIVFDEFGDTLVSYRIDENSYLLKLDSNLTVMQSHTYGGGNNNDRINEVEINEQGKITLGGLMTAFFDYDLQDDSIVRLPNPNSGSPFLAQYDQNLNLIQAHILISNSRDQYIAVETDPLGSLYGVATVSDTLLLINQGDSILFNPGAVADWLLTHYDPHGQLVWYKTLAASEDLELLGFERDAAGTLHLVGETFADSLLFSDSLLISTENAFRFWMEIDQNGVLQRFRTVDIPFTDTRAAFHQNIQGDFFFTGRLQSDRIFDFESGEPATGIDGFEFYVARYSADGAIRGATGLGHLAIQTINNLTFYPDGGIGLVLQHPAEVTLNFNPTPQGEITTDELSNMSLSRFCFPQSEERLIDQTCAGDEIVLTADPSYLSASYFDAKTLEKLADSLTVGVTNDRDSIIVVLRDQNNCPNYDVVILADLDCTTTAVDEIAVKKTRVYPNPAQNEVIIQGHIVMEVTVGDMSGNIILNNKDRGAGHPMDLSGLPPGLYWLRCTLEDGTVEHHKLIMQP